MQTATGVVRVHLQAYLQWVVKSGRQGPFQKGLAFDCLWAHPRQTCPLPHALLTVTPAPRDGAGFVSCPLSLSWSASLVAQPVKNPSEMQEILVQFLGREYPLEKG